MEIDFINHWTDGNEVVDNFSIIDISYEQQRLYTKSTIFSFVLMGIGVWICYESEL